jgi:hypothetical protein
LEPSERLGYDGSPKIRAVSAMGVNLMVSYAQKFLHLKTTVIKQNTVTLFKTIVLTQKYKPPIFSFRRYRNSAVDSASLN